MALLSQIPTIRRAPHTHLPVQVLGDGDRTGERGEISVDSLDLRVFNVGHGLSVALIEKPENYVTLVDLGTDIGFTPLKYLSLKLGLKPDVLYITHPHADHIDDVETALDPRFRPDGIYYENFDWEDVKEREKPALRDRVEKFEELIGRVPFRQYGGVGELKAFLYRPEDAKANFGESSYINNSSLFIVYAWRGFKISIAGDLESEAMAGMVATDDVQKAARGTDILIPSHHGHKNGFPTEWVARMGKPSISIISVQTRDEHVDSRYSSSAFAKGVTIGGKTSYTVTTRGMGNILVNMHHGPRGDRLWNFTTF